MMFPQVPNLHALGAMALTVLALWAFTRDRYPLEISSFGLLAVLAAGFAIFPFGDLKPSAFFMDWDTRRWWPSAPSWSWAKVWW